MTLIQSICTYMLTPVQWMEVYVQKLESQNPEAHTIANDFSPTYIQQPMTVLAAGRWMQYSVA